MLSVRSWLAKSECHQHRGMELLSEEFAVHVKAGNRESKK